MFKKIWLGVIILMLVFSCPVFAGGFIGMGGDAEFFPKNLWSISFFATPFLYSDQVPNGLTGGLEVTIGSNDLSFALRSGVQGDMRLSGMDIRKKIFKTEDDISCLLIAGGDSIYVYDPDIKVTYNILSIGGVVSKRYGNLIPYFGLFYSSFNYANEYSTPHIRNNLNGFGLSGGVRAELNEKWSSSLELVYSDFQTTSEQPWPESVLYSTFKFNIVW